MKVRDLVKLLEADGWRLARTRGGHRQYKHPLEAEYGDGFRQSRRGDASGDAWQRIEAGGFEKIGGGGIVRYMVVVERGEKGFGAYVPDLTGCVSAGESREEVLSLIREAIVFHLEAMREDGEEPPSPTSSGEYVNIGAA